MSNDSLQLPQKPSWIRKPSPELARAVQLHEDGDLDQAGALYRDLLARDPAHPDALRGLGVLADQAGDVSGAIQFLRQAIAVDPQDALSQVNLGKILLARGQVQDAIPAFTEALRLNPHDAMSRHVLAGLTGQGTPEAPPDRYAERLFDDYAENYDHHLINVLGYRIPQFCLETVQALKPAGKLDILDLGCGTGLCGILFRDLARTLEGVDLSPNMLEKARALGIYDRLTATNLLNVLNAAVDAYDLVLAADVFAYIGDLAPVLTAAASALRPQGWMVFSCETHDESRAFRLNATIRYSHSSRYVERLASDTGFSVLVSKPISGRVQAGKPVPGHLFALCNDISLRLAQPAG